jgi:hypothetical protein
LKKHYFSNAVAEQAEEGLLYCGNPSRYRDKGLYPGQGISEFQKTEYVYGCTFELSLFTS